MRAVERATHEGSYLGVSPIKQPSWKPGMIPGYFWLGGLAAGAWLVVTLDELVGEGDGELQRLGRYAAATALGSGTILLIVDLGRPERFLNMLRVVRLRSAMNLGAWGLSAFGGAVGIAALRELLVDWRGAPPGEPALLDRAINLAGLGPGLFVGSYTGTLLSSTSVPAWAERTSWLSPLFATSSASSGTGALLVLGELAGTRESTARRLARAQAVALALELGIGLASERTTRRLPSHQDLPLDERLLRLIAHGGAFVGALFALRGAASPRRRLATVEADARYRSLYGPADVDEDAELPDRRAGRARIAAGALALAGGLALRFLVTRAGRRSARTAADTWEHAR